MADMTMEAVRNQYPQYKDMPDEQLADALYTKFGNGAPRDQFYARIGAQSPASVRPAPAADLASLMAGSPTQAASAVPDLAATMAASVRQSPVAPISPDLDALAATMAGGHLQPSDRASTMAAAQTQSTGTPAMPVASPGPTNNDTLLSTMMMQPAQQAGPQEAQSDAEAMFPSTGRSFGIGGFGRNVVNKAADIVGLDVPFPQVQRTVANFDVLGERIVADISAAYDRPPSWMLRRIASLAPDAASPFTGPQQAEEQLKALANDVVGEIDTLNAQLSSGSEMTTSGRQKVEAKLAGMKAANGRILAALDSFGPAPEYQRTGTGVKWRIAQ